MDFTVSPCGFLDWRHRRQETAMGKYFLAWVLGVPAGLLVLLYLIFN